MAAWRVHSQKAQAPHRRPQPASAAAPAPTRAHLAGRSQTAAESLAVPDESFDLVYCVYLFHELPADIRRKAAAEMAR